MKIKNFDELAKSEARKNALLIAEAGLEAIDTERIIKNNVRLQNGSLLIKGNAIQLDTVKKLFVICVGKCSLEAGTALEEVLDDVITDGIVLDIKKSKLRKLRVYGGTNPLPSDSNTIAPKAIIKLLSGGSEEDLVIFVISGGGSTLLSQPANSTF
ncbi:MAG: DUF4147 domain-containing protein, partial [Patescibacteria group bacterium]